MNEFFLEYPKMKEQMIFKILENPYDLDRDTFVNICRKRISWLEHVDDKVIRYLYYSCTHGFYSYNEKLFDVGDKCNCIYVITSGWIDIQISDGAKTSVTLDTLGPGSFIGQSFVLKQEPFPYMGINREVQSC